MMRRSRHVRWTGLTVVLFFLVSACGGDPAASETQATDPSEAASLPAWEPDGAVTITVPAGPGGGSDLFGRALAAGLHEVRPDVDFVVENRPGGNTAVAYNHGLQQAGDPHQLVMNETALVSLPLVTEVPYSWRDFTPIGLAGAIVPVALAHPGDFGSLEELVTSGDDGTITVGLAGLAGPLATAVSLLAAEVPDVVIDRVVFDSAAEAVAAAASGDVDFAMAPPGVAVENVKAGRVEALAVFDAQRLDDDTLADVPTAAEAGVDVAFTGIYGLMGAPDLSTEEQEYWISALLDWTKTESYSDYTSTNLSAVPEIVVGSEYPEYLQAFEEQLQSVLKVEN